MDDTQSPIIRSHFGGGEAFRRTVTAQLREKARIADEASPSETDRDARRHVRLLRELAEFIEQLPLSDARLGALWHARRWRAGLEEWKPGGNQSMLLGLLGQEERHAGLTHDEIFAELIEAAIEDIRPKARENQRAQVEKQVREEVERQVKPLSETKEQAEAKVEKLEATVAEGKVEREELTKQLDTAKILAAALRKSKLSAGARTKVRAKGPPAGFKPKSKPKSTPKRKPPKKAPEKAGAAKEKT
jgi:hypothetical protein